MNILKAIVLLALPGVAMAQQSNFSIEGTIQQPKKEGKVFVSIYKQGIPILDSVTLNNGMFSYKGTTNGITSVYLVYDHDNKGWGNMSEEEDMINIYVDKGKTTIIGKDSLTNATISGAPIQTEYAAFKARFKESEKGMDAINIKYRSASEEQREDELFTDHLKKQFEELLEQKKKLLEDFIAKNPNSYFSIISLHELLGTGKEILELEPAYNSLTKEVRDSEIGLEIAKQIQAAKSTEIGSVAPDFTQNDVNDKPVKLSDFRGKYVLLDFWASWCGPCRAENPNVVAAYERFKDKNFAILGVSLDQQGKKEDWLNAIHTDKLTWTNVSDLNFWNNQAAKLYGVRGIPQNFLISPDGKIVAKDLRGNELHQKLAELLN